MFPLPFKVNIMQSSNWFGTNSKTDLTVKAGWGRDRTEALLLVVVPLDEVVALGHKRLPVAALPLVLQEICPLEELLLVELELPHLSIEASRVSQPAQRNKSPLEQKVFLQEEQEQARLGLLANGRKISTNGDAAGSAGVPADWSAAPLESRIGYEKVYLCPFAAGEVA